MRGFRTCACPLTSSRATRPAYDSLAASLHLCTSAPLREIPWLRRPWAPDGRAREVGDPYQVRQRKGASSGGCRASILSIPSMPASPKRRPPARNHRAGATTALRMTGSMLAVGQPSAAGRRGDGSRRRPTNRDIGGRGWGGSARRSATPHLVAAMATKNRAAGDERQHDDRLHQPGLDEDHRD